MRSLRDDFADDGASFRVRREAQLRRRYAPLLDRPEPIYVYEHIFDRGALRLLRVLSYPILAAAAVMLASIAIAILYGLWLAAVG